MLSKVLQKFLQKIAHFLRSCLACDHGIQELVEVLKTEQQNMNTTVLMHVWADINVNINEATLQLSPAVLLLAIALWPKESISVDVIIGRTI